MKTIYKQYVAKKLIIFNKSTDTSVSFLAVYRRERSHTRVARTYLYACWLCFDLRFSEWKIQPISMIFGILNK